LREPVSSRVASDVLRRLLDQGVVHLARQGKPSAEALYTRKRRLP
jgi:ribosomal protein S25